MCLKNDIINKITFVTWYFDATFYFYKLNKLPILAIKSSIIWLLIIKNNFIVNNVLFCKFRIDILTLTLFLV